MTGAATALALLVRRDVARAYTGGGVWLPVVFYLSAATLFPFAVGPDAALLARTGGGVLWIAALLATLLPLDRLVEPDARAGVLDQLRLRGLADEWIATARIAAHWIGFAPPLLGAAMVGATLMGQDTASMGTLLAGLAIASPALASLGVTIAALTTGLKGAGALGGLLLVPLAIPLLIFGAGSLADPGGSGLFLLAATSLFLTAIGPFAAGAGLRAARE